MNRSFLIIDPEKALDKETAARQLELTISKPAMHNERGRLFVRKDCRHLDNFSIRQLSFASINNKICMQPEMSLQGESMP